MIRMTLKIALAAAALAMAGTAAQAQSFVNERGHVCQRASSGNIVCRDPRDRWSQGYVYRGGGPGFYRPEPRPRFRAPQSRGGFYNSAGHFCQRASSGNIVCRDPRDRWSQGYVYRGY